MNLVIRNEQDLKQVLARDYMKTMQNFLGNEDNARRFMSAIVADTQRNPALLQCDPASLMNAYMTMANCGFYPSSVSQEAYVIPYGGQAQFQLGYQGLVTLLYKAGVESIDWAIVRENDEAKMVNNKLEHSVPLGMSKKERGAAVGAYVTVSYRGKEITKYMNGKDIIEHAKKFSKSFNTKSSPWKEENDPELTMWAKTVLKQMSKTLPKNEMINRALAEDNRDSKMHDRIEAANKDRHELSMGKLEVNNEESENAARQAASGEENQEDTAEPPN